MTTPDTQLQYTLPEGATTRPLTLDDAEMFKHFSDAANIAKNYNSVTDLQDLKTDWQAPKFNLADSSHAVFAADGEMLGYATIWDNMEPPVSVRFSWNVRDDLYGTGLDHYLLRWLEDTAQRVIDRCPPEAQIVMKNSVLEGYDKRVQALTAAGYEHKRNWYRMLIELDAKPPAPILPEHIIMRPMKYPDEFMDVVIADRDGFRDHYGFVETPIEEDYKEWKYFIDNDPIFTPDVYHLAIDTRNDQIAGVCLCRTEQWGKPDTAYIESVAVLPAYRKQGIALGMLHHAFNDFWDRDRKKIALHVDASSLTGATRLYTRAGMHTDENWMSFHKVLRDGISLETQQVGDNAKDS